MAKELPAAPKSIELVIFDADQTYYKGHTGGALIEKAITASAKNVVPAFLELVPQLLSAGVHVAVATYSDELMLTHAKLPATSIAGEELVRRLLHAAFLEHYGAEKYEKFRSQVESMPVAAAYPRLRNLHDPAFNEPHLPMPTGSKLWHINKIRQLIGKEIPLSHIMMFDDCAELLTEAASLGVHTRVVSAAHAFQVSDWVEAVQLVSAAVPTPPVLDNAEFRFDRKTMKLETTGVRAPPSPPVAQFRWNRETMTLESIRTRAPSPPAPDQQHAALRVTPRRTGTGPDGWKY